MRRFRWSTARCGQLRSTPGCDSASCGRSGGSRSIWSSARIHVIRAWDPHEGFIEPKSKAGRRVVPIARILRDHLLEHTTRVEPGIELVFCRAEGKPFDPASINRWARRAWKAAGLRGIGLHECRHTFASLLIAAGVNAKVLSTYVGHSSVATTYDLYGHLMPGNEAEAIGRLDTYLEPAVTD